MRTSSSLLTSNYMSDLRQVQNRLAKLLHQTSTGRAFDRPSDAPGLVATSINLRSTLTYLSQYNRNADDGLSRLSYAETSLSEVNSQLQRVRELAVQGSNTYLTRGDRTALAQEMNQLVEHLSTLANSNLSGRFIFSGHETLKEPFQSNSNTNDGLINSLTYRGDMGQIGRNIAVGRDLAVNFNGKQLFLEKTWTAEGRQLSDSKLGYSGAFELNNELFVVSPGMNARDLRDMINSRPGAEVLAELDGSFRLSLTSLNSSQSVRMKDVAGSVLTDLGLQPQGAINHAQTGPTLPLTDSRGALHTGAVLAFPLSVTTANQDLVVRLGGAANDGFSQSEVLKIEAKTYNNMGELAAELQKRADLAFGEKKLIFGDDGLGALQVESFVQSSAVTSGDLMLGGTHSDGTADSLSGLLGFNAVPTVPEVADTAGTDGNDRFVIDLGKSAYRSLPGEAAVDLAPVEINIDASVTNLDELIADINKQILGDRFASGLVEAVKVDNRIMLRSTREGAEVLAGDLAISNAVGGAPLPASDTLGALGFYRDALTGASGPPVPAAVQSTAAYPPGIAAIVAGVNDSFSIQLGPGSSLDGTRPDPVTLTITPGAYATPAALAAELNSRISLSPVLKNAVQAVVRNAGGLDYVDIETVTRGSAVQADDLVLSDVNAGTLANLGLGSATVPGGGSSNGQGRVTAAANMVDTVLSIRDELLGYASGDSRLAALGGEGGSALGLFPGNTIRIHSEGTFSEFTVQRFTTMDELAERIEEKLGFQLEVEVLRDGRVRVFNPSTSVINDVKIEAFDASGQHVAQFEKAFAPISGKLSYRTELRSDSVYDDSAFQNMTQRIGDVDKAMDTMLSALAQLGSRTKRLELTLTQAQSVEVNLRDLQSKNDTVDIAETIIQLKQQENVLNSALGAGGRVLPASLFDFLR